MAQLSLSIACWRIRSLFHARYRYGSRAEHVGEGDPLTTEPNLAELNTLIATATQRKAEDLLRDSERQLRFVTDKAPIAIAYCDTAACSRNAVNAS